MVIVRTSDIDSDGYRDKQNSMCLIMEQSVRVDMISEMHNPSIGLLHQDYTRTTTEQTVIFCCIMHKYRSQKG